MPDKLSILGLLLSLLCLSQGCEMPSPSPPGGKARQEDNNSYMQLKRKEKGKPDKAAAGPKEVRIDKNAGNRKNALQRLFSGRENSTHNQGSTSPPTAAGRRFNPEPADSYTPAELELAKPFTHLLLGEKDYHARYKMLVELEQTPAPRAEGALRVILASPGDPLSPRAARALAALASPTAREALRLATADPRPTTASAALLGLVLLHDKEAEKLVREFIDKKYHLALRTTATLGIGELQLHDFRQRLRLFTSNAHPNLRLSAGWSLWRLGDPYGVAFLRSIALTGDATYAPQAIAFMNSMKGDKLAHEAMLSLLAARKPDCWHNAFVTLHGWLTEDSPAADDKGGGLVSALTGKNNLYDRRVVLLTIAWHSDHGRVWDPDTTLLQRALPLLLEITADAKEEEKKLLAEVLAGWPHLRGLEPLLRLLTEDGEVGSAAVKALHNLVDKTGLPAPPRGDGVVAWRRWWLRNSRAAFIMLAGREEAAVQGPDGAYYIALPGRQLVPGVDVIGLKREADKPLIKLRHNGRNWNITPTGPKE